MEHEGSEEGNRKQAESGSFAGRCMQYCMQFAELERRWERCEMRLSAGYLGLGSEAADEVEAKEDDIRRAYIQ